MKFTRIITATVVVAALGLAACSSGSTTPSTPTSSAPSISAPVSPTSQAQVVRAALATQGITVAGDDASIDAVGAALVDVLDTNPINAALLLQLSTISADSFGVSAEKGGFIVGVLIATYAPQYVDEVTAVIDSLSSPSYTTN